VKYQNEKVFIAPDRIAAERVKRRKLVQLLYYYYSLYSATQRIKTRRTPAERLHQPG
jgi:hypothetical protein